MLFFTLQFFSLNFLNLFYNLNKFNFVRSTQNLCIVVLALRVIINQMNGTYLFSFKDVHTITQCKVTFITSTTEYKSKVVLLRKPRVTLLTPIDANWRANDGIMDFFVTSYTFECYFLRYLQEKKCVGLSYHSYPTRHSIVFEFLCEEIEFIKYSGFTGNIPKTFCTYELKARTYKKYILKK